jgi:hypothetical protein
MIAFSGVRSSWLMLARKALLARLAASASSRAATRARMVCESSSPIMLRPIAMALTMSSLSSLTVILRSYSRAA